MVAFLKEWIMTFRMCVLAGMAAAIVMAARVGSVSAEAGGAASAPATGPAASSAPRGATDLNSAMAEIQAGQSELSKILEEDGVYSDASKRAAALKNALPAMEKMADGAVAFKEPRYMVMYTQVMMTVEPTRVALGDEAFSAKLKDQSAGTGDDARHARAVLARGAYLAAGKDEAAQGQAIELLAGLVKDYPEDKEVAYVLSKSHFDPASTPASQDKIEAALKGSKTAEAKSSLAMWQGDRTLAAMVNKPLVMKAAKEGGGEFSSDEYKGKVILVDFWATWCRPCVGELPRVTKIYEKYHAQGLELIGVSCDQSEKPLQDWLAAHKEMTWVQLFDPKTPGWHPLAKAYGINGIPTMFLIDKKGVLRTVKAREEMEELIPKLLAE